MIKDPPVPYINILSKRYEVKIDPTLPYCGESNHHSCIISYRPQNSAQLADTLLHESIHALDYAVQLNLTEQQVHALAALFINLLKTNKKLTEILLND